jgi:hypothetical protein
MKATIIFEDLPNGDLSTKFEFDPAIDDNTQSSPALDHAYAIMDLLSDNGDNDDSE